LDAIRGTSIFVLCRALDAKKHCEGLLARMGM
jgi:hypothetical protein